MTNVMTEHIEKMKEMDLQFLISEKLENKINQFSWVSKN